MSRIARKFETLRSRNECALIPFLTAGFPSPEATPDLLRSLEAAGCDIIELGVPFSDPIADGPTIQRASSDALNAGITLSAILKMVADFRRTSELPILLFGAYNPFFHYGIDKLCADAHAAGVDALLIPDLSAEEAGEIQPQLKQAGLDLIFLVAPTTPKQRKSEICSQASGFIYYISVKGVTGARKSVQVDVSDAIADIRHCTDLPVAVGFGLSTPAQAAGIARIADAAVVGSALIDFIRENATSSNLPGKTEQYMREFKTALRSARAPSMEKTS